MAFEKFIQESLRDQAADNAAKKVAAAEAPVSTSPAVPTALAMKAFQETVALNSRRAAYAQRLMRG